jgi:hypothetical protein
MTGYGLDGPGSILGMASLSLLCSVQSGSGAQAPSYPVGTGGNFFWGRD